MADIAHTDAVEQAKFLALKPDEQLLQIWLNGRETNGSVTVAMEKIAIIERLEPRVRTIETRVIQAMAVIAVLVVLTPLLSVAVLRLGG